MIQEGHRFLALITTGVGVFFLTPTLCYAQTLIRDIEGMLDKVVDLLLGLGGSVGIILIIVGGIRYITSGGDQNSIASAKKMITMAVLGVVLVLGAAGILNLVIRALGGTP